MATPRGTISKKLRFEVLKRDNFTCQYCGRSSPDVLLEIDHLKPISKGGKNEIFNLITSCKDCNRGKGKVELSDNAEIKKQRRQLEELNERKKQLRMMVQWREELSNLNNKLSALVADHLQSVTGYQVSDIEERTIIRILSQFSIDEVISAIDAGMVTYRKFPDIEKAQTVLRALGGICYNRRYRIGNTAIH